MIETLQACREHNRTARDLVIADASLRGVDLSGLRADGLELREVDLTNAGLGDVRWRNCTLVGVRLGGALCRGAVLRMCRLEGVRAARSDFSAARIENTEGHGAVFDDANFTGASLIDSDLGRASFQRAILDDVDASGVDLRGADLRGASLRGACLADVDLRGADLTGAALDGADLRGADLRGAILDAEALVGEGEPLSPALEEMAEAAGPVVARILREGEARGLLDAEAQARMMDTLRRSGWARNASAGAPPQVDAAIQAALRRVAETGLGPLLEALRQDQDGPPQAVATMLEKLAADLELGEGATAEDLIALLVEALQHPRREADD